MKKIIKKHIENLKELTTCIGGDIRAYLDSLSYDGKDPSVQIVELTNEDSISQLYTDNGFYIILTDHVFSDNDCGFSYNKQVAIYRGHCYSVKNRIYSHLANQYHNDFGKPKYKTCLKIESGVNGININEKPYSNWKWTVIIHKMRGSNKLIREQAEVAFDSLYGKPCKSRE